MQIGSLFRNVNDFLLANLNNSKGKQYVKGKEITYFLKQNKAFDITGSQSNFQTILLSRLLSHFL